MQQRLIIILILVLGLISACQALPPTQVIIVVTATPETIEATAEAVDPTITQAQPTAAATETATETPVPQPTSDPALQPQILQIQAAEQVFEGGRMFWLQPVNQIWVMVASGEGQGEWLIYEDTFQEGEMESDPNLTPPDGLLQPQRGFGKLWRNNPDLREILGWAVTPEFGYVTSYEYHPGEDGFGFHVLTTLYEEQFRFNEEDQTWELN